MNIMASRLFTWPHVLASVYELGGWRIVVKMSLARHRTEQSVVSVLLRVVVSHTSNLDQYSICRHYHNQCCSVHAYPHCVA